MQQNRVFCCIKDSCQASSIIYLTENLLGVYGDMLPTYFINIIEGNSVSEDEKHQFLGEGISSGILKKGLSSGNLQTGLGKKPANTSQSTDTSEKSSKNDK